MNQNYIDIYIDNNSADSRIRCHSLIRQSNTLTGFIEDVPIFGLANKIVADNTLIKQIRLGRIVKIVSRCFDVDDGENYYGKLLVTFMLDGIVKEIKCNSISKYEGKLILNIPERIHKNPKLYRGHVEDYEVTSDFILKHCYGFYKGNDYYPWLYFDSMDIIRIEPYPEDIDNYNYSFQPYQLDVPIGEIETVIDIFGKTIWFDGFRSGKVEFPSKTEMFSSIKEWQKSSKEGFYPFEISEIEYLENDLFGKFTIKSNTFTYADLEEKLGFEVCHYCRYYEERDENSYLEFKEWENDAYEGYSSEYLGLD